MQSPIDVFLRNGLWSAQGIGGAVTCMLFLLMSCQPKSSDQASDAGRDTTFSPETTDAPVFPDVSTANERQIWEQTESFQQPTNSEDFGEVLAISGDGLSVLVGDPRGGSDQLGQALVFTKSDEGWDQGTPLPRPEGARTFGSSVALSSDGSTAMVGDLDGGEFFNGIVLAYNKTDGRWSAGTKISHEAAGQDFGLSISLSGDGQTLLAGEVFDGGKAHVFKKVGSQWTDVRELVRPVNSVWFGMSVAISGDGKTAVVSDPFEHEDRVGVITVYKENSNGTWDGGEQLETPMGARSFGDSVAISFDGTTIAAGDGKANMQGEVTVFSKLMNGWGQGVQVRRPSAARQFGQEVSLSGDGRTLLVGDRLGDRLPRIGIVMVYRREADHWNQGDFLPRPTNTLAFGTSIGISVNGEVAAISDVMGGENAGGSVLVYEVQ